MSKKNKSFELNEDALENCEKEWVLKARVPFEEMQSLYDWREDCKKAPPEGYNNFFWAKMKHDHMFVKTFQSKIKSIDDKQSEILELLKKFIEKPKEKEDNKDLFK
jgi:hypothetical protein